MRISINLASRPFVELRPLFARLRIAMAVLLVMAFGLGFWLHALNVRAKQATAQMDALKARTRAYEQERAANEARMQQPQNAGVLARARFLNAVFATKSFSWTGVMMDLEKVLPTGVQVTSIEPTVSKEGDVSIRLRVTGDRDRAIQLVRNLENSDRFVKPRLGGETALSAEKATAFGRAPAAGLQNVSTAAELPGGVEFEIFSGYNPLPKTAGIKAQGTGISKPAVPKAKKKVPSPLPGARPNAAKPHPGQPLLKQVPAGGAR